MRVARFLTLVLVGTFTLEPGIVIKPGASLCASLNVAGINTIAFPRLTRFLAKDK